MELPTIGYAICVLAISVGGAESCLYLLHRWHHPRILTRAAIRNAAVSGVFYGFMCLSAHAYVNKISDTVFTILFGLALLYGAVIDKRYFILPDEGAVFIGIVGLLQWSTVSLSHIMTVIFIVGIGYILRRLSHGGMGEGDIKWTAAIACWLAPILIMRMLLIACTAGIVWGLHTYGRNIRHHRIPFGPFLCTAAWLIYLWNVLQK